MLRKTETVKLNKFHRTTIETNQSIEWFSLEDELIAILNSRKTSKALEELYRIIENLCTTNYEPLYYNLQTIIEEFLHVKLSNFNDNDANILIILDELWREFYRNIKIIKNLFLPINRLLQKITYNTIQNTSLQLFNRIIVTNPMTQPKIIDKLLKLIHEERTDNNNNNINDKILIKSIIELFNTLQIYDKIFQNEFLKTTRQFYDDEAQILIKSTDLPQYLKHTYQRIVEEQNRVKNYLNNTTETPLLNIIYYELIENHSSTILDKGFSELIDKNRVDDLSLAYKLFQRRPKSFKRLLIHFNCSINRKGRSLIEADNERLLIENLLNFKQQLETIIEKSFDNNPEFYNSIRLTFKSLITTTNNNKIAQLLAKYLDSRLCSQRVNEQNFDTIINRILQLFKYLQYKDVFEEFYKRYLAKRLLFNKSLNIEAENCLVTKLKLECGDNFTMNIENMLQDINISKTINLAFKQKQIKNDFFINVLTNSYWPNYPNYKINLPIELVNYQQLFEQFYNSYHNGRKLLWQSTLTYCLIRANFTNNTKEFQTSLYQTVILLLYNHNDRLNLSEIQELTCLDLYELKRTLASLNSNKLLLRKSDTFTINPDYMNRLFRIKINYLQSIETFEQKSEVEHKVLIDRQYQIDAAIVRILKKFKRIPHNLLMNELYQILDIPVQQNDIKKRIELLIEREYMERDKDNNTCYMYIA